jgi:hypothetical protein
VVLAGFAITNAAGGTVKSWQPTPPPSQPASPQSSQAGILLLSLPVSPGQNYGGYQASDKSGYSISVGSPNPQNPNASTSGEYVDKVRARVDTCGSIVNAWKTVDYLSIADPSNTSTPTWTEKITYFFAPQFGAIPVEIDAEGTNVLGLTETSKAHIAQVDPDPLPAK